LKKRTKKLLVLGVRADPTVPGNGQGRVAKVFLFFFSKKNRFLPLNLTLGLLTLSLIVLPALLSLVWTPSAPGKLDILHRLAGPSAAHLLGTDPFGRDVLSILMIGARNSIAICSAAILLGACIGIPGGLAAARGGWPGGLLMRAADLGLAFPPVLTASMIVAIEGAGWPGTVLAIGLFNVPAFLRLTSVEARAILGRDYIAAARIAGRSRAAILAVHVLPNIAATLLVQATVALALAILAESGLSYLGLGTPPPAPSLGRALADYQTHIFDDPLLVIAPGLAISALVLGLNQLGDGLRDVLDPRLARAR
jgi:peptide/nickel transport system permease protein